MFVRCIPTLIFFLTLSSCAPAWQAARDGDNKRLTNYLNSGGPIEARVPATAATLLAAAACAGQLETVKLLVERGADLNSRNNMGLTPLMCAASWGRLEVSRYLVDKGADMRVLDSSGLDFLSHSFNSGDAIAEYALSAIRDPSKQSLSSALINAAAKNIRISLVRGLIDRGAEVDARGRGGSTALHWAANVGNVSTVRYFLEVGANPELADNDGNDAIRIAQLWKRSEVVDLLREAVKRRMAGQVPVVPRATALRVTQGDSRPEVVPTFSLPQDPESYAVVIGIEKYPDLPEAIYAERDAASAKLFIQALGVPERNLVFLSGSRATKTGMEKTIEAWLPNNVSVKSRVYFYYSGHGAPDPKTGDAYLVPSDGDPQYLAQTGYPLKRLYEKLSQLKVKSVLVTLDSCFSGAGGRSVLAKGTRPLVGKVDMAIRGEGNLSVISASAGDQVSGANDEAGYGLFTYNFLQGLNGAARDPQGQVTLKSLYGYLKPRVQDEARRGNREQTPQLQGGAEAFVLRSK